jgi:hypothetical protein
MFRRIAGVVLILLFVVALFAAETSTGSPGTYEEVFPGLSDRVFWLWVIVSGLVKLTMVLGLRVRALNVMATILWMGLIFIAFFFERQVVGSTGSPFAGYVVVTFFLVWLYSDALDLILGLEEAKEEVVGVELSKER